MQPIAAIPTDKPWSSKRNIMTNIIFEKGITNVCDNVFDDYNYNGICSKFRNVRIGNTVTTIGSLAFANTKLTELTLPENLTTLGAFILNENTTIFDFLNLSATKAGRVEFIAHVSHSDPSVPNFLPAI